MNKSLVGIIATTLLLSACSAFDSGGAQVVSTPGADPSISEGCAESGAFDGYYSGTMTLGADTCEALDGLEGSEEALAIDVVQGCTAVTAKFEDGSEANASLNATRAVFVVKKEDSTWIYDLSFNEEGATGTVEVSDSTSAGSIEACANFSVELTKGEKPAAE